MPDPVLTTARLTPDRASYAVVSTTTLPSRGATPEAIDLIISERGGISVRFLTHDDYPSNIVQQGELVAFDAHISARVDASVRRYLISATAWRMARQFAADARNKHQLEVA